MTPELWAEEGLYQGDCRALLAKMPENSVDSGVFDPPYGIGFMGREWDTFKPGVESTRVIDNRQVDSANPNLAGRSRAPASSPSAVEYDRTATGQQAFQAWTESWAVHVLRVLKPGAHLAVFGAPRSFHRMACGLEDAGFEVRDTLCWLFGQGFPKSLNLGEGWGTALKPGWEPIVLVRKPLGKMTTTAAYAKYGTGGLNIDDCRILAEDDEYARNASGDRGHAGTRETTAEGVTNFHIGGGTASDLGRWPANVILDEQAGALLDEQAGERTSGANPTARKSNKFANTYGDFAGQPVVCTPARGAERGGASRFFYCPKVSRAEREFGCDHLPLRTAGEATGGRQEGSAALANPRTGASRSSGAHNAHPTVKPVALLRWLAKLITPQGGLVLDAFVGSGSTGIAADAEGFGFIGMDLEAEWLTVAHARIGAWRERGQN